MITSETINELAAALAKAQGAIEPASKNAENPHYKSKFADLSSIREAIRLPLSENGLCVLQDIATNETNISVVTRLVHCSGQWIQFGPLSIPVTKKDAQGVGSAISYGKRYSLCAALGVVSDIDKDDDGNAAVGKAALHVEPVKLISLNQHHEMTRLLGECEDEFKGNFWALAKQHYGATSATDFPESKYEGAINWIKKHIEKKKLVDSEATQP